MRVASFLLAPLAIAFGVMPASAETITACPAKSTARGCAFTGDGAIQAAIDRARDGDTVLVRAGIYQPRAYRDLPYKEIVIRAFVAVEGKRLTLQGEPGVILDGSVGLPTTAIALKNADVTIRNLDITGFHWAIQEDDIYDGHGIFAVDSRARIAGVTIRNYQKMGLTGRGNTFLDVTDLKILDGHVGSWLYDGAYMRLDRAVFRNNESAAVAAYDTSVARVSHIAVDRSTDDALYAEDDAAIYVTHSLIVASKPIALNATGRSRIIASHLALHGNAADTSASGVILGDGIVRADPRVDADYKPLPGSPIAGKDIGPAGGGQ
jgi:hypothetical protein